MEFCTELGFRRLTRITRIIRFRRLMRLPDRQADTTQVCQEKEESCDDPREQPPTFPLGRADDQANAADQVDDQLLNKNSEILLIRFEMRIEFNFSNVCFFSILLGSQSRGYTTFAISVRAF
jgi:hypothetical protein